MKKIIITQHGSWFSFSPSGHTFYSNEIKVNGLPFAYAYKEGNDSIYKVYFKPVDGWRNMDCASDWVNDWENDIHHIGQVTSNVSDSLDLLQQLN